MSMKKTNVFLLTGAVAIAGAAIVYRAVNKAPDASLPADQATAQIFDDGGCIFCHTANPGRPCQGGEMHPGRHHAVDAVLSGTLGILYH